MSLFCSGVFSYTTLSCTLQTESHAHRFMAETRVMLLVPCITRSLAQYFGKVPGPVAAPVEVGCVAECSFVPGTAVFVFCQASSSLAPT